MVNKLDEMAHRAIMSFRQHVNSIKKVDVRQDHWFDSAGDLIKEFGFTNYGSGEYGLVFSKPQLPYVVKLFMKDAAYLKWMDFCKQHSDNPYCPKIRGKVIRITDIFYVIRLEKLEPISTRSGWYDLSKILSEPEWALRTWDSRPSEVPQLKDPHLRQILMFFARNKKLLDIHSGNVMRRGDQVVIIDPFYNNFIDGKFQIDPDDLSELKSIL